MKYNITPNPKISEPLPSLPPLTAPPPTHLPSPIFIIGDPISYTSSSTLPPNYPQFKPKLQDVALNLATGKSKLKKLQLERKLEKVSGFDDQLNIDKYTDHTVYTNQINSNYNINTTTSNPNPYKTNLPLPQFPLSSPSPSSSSSPSHNITLPTFKTIPQSPPPQRSTNSHPEWNSHQSDMVPYEQYTKRMKQAQNWECRYQQLYQQSQGDRNSSINDNNMQVGYNVDNINRIVNERYYPTTFSPPPSLLNPIYTPTNPNPTKIQITPTKSNLIISLKQQNKHLQQCIQKLEKQQQQCLQYIADTIDNAKNSTLNQCSEIIDQYREEPKFIYQQY